MATHSSVLAWRIPWTGEPGGLQSTGLQRVGHNLVTEQQQQDNLFFWPHRSTDRAIVPTDGPCSRILLIDLHVLEDEIWDFLRRFET